MASLLICFRRCPNWKRRSKRARRHRPDYQGDGVSTGAGEVIIVCWRAMVRRDAFKTSPMMRINPAAAEALVF
jgi:hypothetical protein